MRISASFRQCAQSAFRRGASLLLSALPLIWLTPANAPAQELTSLEAATAIQDAFVEAIAAAEKSVVSIARIRRSEDDVRPLAGFGAGVFGGPLGGNAADPNDPYFTPDRTFIPNEYGTGVVVDAGGLILTNYHVIVQEGQYWVAQGPGRFYTAQVVAADPRSDLAVLSIDAEGLKPIKFGHARSLKKGHIVIALGNPQAIARDGQPSASWGIVANLARMAAPLADAIDSPADRKTTLHHHGTLIQTDAKLNLGTSGGALINLRGEMVGLTTAQAAAAGFEESAGYAIPVDDTFLRVVDTLKEGREVEYGLLGVVPLDLGPAATTFGCRIESVFLGTPADRAGLRAGDIVTHVDGEEVLDADDLMLRIGRLPVGAYARLDLLSQGRKKSVSVELAKFMVPGHKIVTNPRPAWRGLHVDYATAVLDERTLREHGTLLNDGCIAVAAVDEGSVAWTQGLRPRDFISHVGQSRVTTPDEFLRAVAGKTGAVVLRRVRPADVGGAGIAAADAGVDTITLPAAAGPYND